MVYKIDIAFLYFLMHIFVSQLNKLNSDFTTSYKKRHLVRKIYPFKNSVSDYNIRSIDSGLDFIQVQN